MVKIGYIGERGARCLECRSQIPQRPVGLFEVGGTDNLAFGVNGCLTRDALSSALLL